MEGEEAPPTPVEPVEDEYLAQRVRDVLAQDPQVSELGISVMVVADRVHLGGDVATLERRETIGRVAARVLPRHRVHNEVRVTSWSQADDMEMLP